MIKRVLSILVLLFISCYFYGYKEREWKTVQDESVRYKYQVIKGTETKDGSGLRYNETNQLVAKEKWANGKENGKWVYYTSSGFILKTIEYQDGKKMTERVNQFSSYTISGYTIQKFSDGQENIIHQYDMKGNYLGKYKNGKKEGKWTIYYDRGRILRKENYTNGELDGPWVQYHITGDVQGQGNYKNGKRVGEWLEYYPNGFICEKGSYDNGLRTGTARKYYKTGELKAIGKYENDLEEGVWKEFYKDGKIKVTGKYVGGKKQGKWYTYYHSGVIREEVDFDQDQINGAWKTNYENGKVRSITYFKKYTYKSYNGKEFESCYYHGEMISYYNSGQISEKGKYEKGRKVGEWITYYESGKKKMVINYKNGRIHGKWDRYDKDGKLTKSESYNNGKLVE